MVRVGLAGIGFMGMIHTLAWRKLPGAQVAAFASRDPRKLAGDWTGIQGNFGPAGTQMDLGDALRFADPLELARAEGIDLVDVCLPNDLHADVAVAALEAGKHVLVEKPIALSLADADRMIDAAGRAGRLLLVAHVLPFFPEFAYALAAIRGGEHGKLLAAHFRRHISPPDWSAAIGDAERTGGPIVDLHIHDTHFVAIACGVPAAVQSCGRSRGGVVEYVSTQYFFADPALTVSAASGALSHPSRPFTHGYEVFLEHATLAYEAGGPVTAYGPGGAQIVPLPAADPVDGFAAELQAALNSLAAGQAAPELDARAARTALALCLRERDSALAGGARQTV